MVMRSYVTYKGKKNYPLKNIRRHLETGPVVLVTSANGDNVNIMTMGWHMMLQFEPALVACYVWDGNESYQLMRESRECVINIPTVEHLDKVVAIGNTHRSESNKFEKFGLTTRAAKKVAAPLIDECYASFECELHDDALLDSYGMFIWRIVKAHVAPLKTPHTVHYRGEGVFMVAGETRSRRAKFQQENL